MVTKGGIDRANAGGETSLKVQVCADIIGAW
jgi:hypothetical protein